MSDYPDVYVRLTHDEYVAIRNTVTGELESLTDEDMKSGVYAELVAADKALVRAWRNWRVRTRKVRAA